MCRFLFPRQVIPYPLGNVCQSLLPNGECHHWQVFFSLLKRFFLLSVCSAQCPAGRAFMVCSIHPSIHLPTYLPTSAYLRVHTYFSLSLPGWAYYLYTVWISISLSLSVCLSAWLPACLSACLSVCLSASVSVRVASFHHLLFFALTFHNKERDGREQKRK